MSALALLLRHVSLFITRCHSDGHYARYYAINRQLAAMLRAIKARRVIVY